jgi:hypothetical protein
MNEYEREQEKITGAYKKKKKKIAAREADHLPSAQTARSCAINARSCAMSDAILRDVN